MLSTIGLIFALVSNAGQDPAPTEPIPIEPLSSLIKGDDYPLEAIEKNEQGRVSMRLIVGSDGRVRECIIDRTSGSASLDSASCKIVMERARFEPARNAEGNPVTAEVTQRINWLLTDTTEPRVRAAHMLWNLCVNGEAAKLALSDLSTEVVAARSFQACSGLEELLAKEISLALPLEDQRAGLSESIETGVLQVRSTFAEESEER